MAVNRCYRWRILACGNPIDLTRVSSSPTILSKPTATLDSMSGKGKISVRNLASTRCNFQLHHIKVLGIETSCDDTGAAIVTDQKQILSESLYNQGAIHNEFGGIIPTLARDLHKKKIVHVVEEAVCNSGLAMDELDAIAVTTKPGLPLSLMIGLNYAKDLATTLKKPLIPIHHMEAHALTARLTDKVEFPYLVLLMSGGHCLLGIVQSVTEYLLLGTSLDISPGDLLDKTARRLRLRSRTELAASSGGAAIEKAAETGDPHKYKFPATMKHSRSCDFSFSGLQFHAKKLIELEESNLGGTSASALPAPLTDDICASLQLATLNLIAKNLYRGFLYSEATGLLPDSNRTLVLSGGVASNGTLRKGLLSVAEKFDCRIVCPPSRLCTDNGVMIAWNGVEKMKLGVDVMEDFTDLKAEHRSPLGESLREDVSSFGLRVPKIKDLM